MTTLSTQMPGSDRAGSMPPTPHDPKVEMLRHIFPEIDADVLASMLAFSNGSVEEACAAILDVNPAVEDTDAAMARAVQQELDAEVARSVQEDLNKAAEAERAAALAKDPTVRAAKAVESAASSTLSMLKKASARTLTAVGARKYAPSSTHGVRLLEASTEPGGDNHLAFNFSPLQVPDYVPSALSVPKPPAVQPLSAPQVAQPLSAPPLSAPPAQASLIDVSDAAEWGPAPTPTPAPTVSTTTPGASADPASALSSSLPAGDRYSSRLERARRSNAASSRSTSVSLSSSPPAGPAAATPHVPVGELI